MKTNLCRLAAGLLFGCTLALPTPPAVAADLATLFEAAARYESGGDVAPVREIETLTLRAIDDSRLRQDLEAALGRMLGSSSTFEAKRFACQQLAILGGETAVPALAALLKSEETAGIACLALARNPSPAAARALREALDPPRDQTHPLVTAQIINTLGGRRDETIVPALVRFADSPKPEVMKAAIWALGRIGNVPARDALTPLRRSSKPEIAEAAAAAALEAALQLADAGQTADALKLALDLQAPNLVDHVRRGAFEMILRLDAAGAAPRIESALRGTDALLKPSAIAAICDLKSPDASAKFGALLPQLPASEQILLIQALAERGDPGARSAVQSQLAATDATVRLAAIAALGQSGDASTVPVLAGALRTSPDPAEAKAVEMALSRLKGGAAVDQALGAQILDRSAGPKGPLLAALVRRAHPTSLRTFLAEAGSTDAAMAKLAFQGLSRVAQPDNVPALLKALGSIRADAAREEALSALGQALNRLGDPARSSAAIRDAYRQAADPAARSAFLSLLVVAPDAPALAAVRGALADSNAAIQETARRALTDWPDAAAWDPLTVLYQQAGTESERVLALRGLARLLGEQNAKPDAQLIGRYRSLLGSLKNDNDRKLVLGALAGCAHPEALQLAVEQLSHAGARAEATLAVKKIAEAIKAQHPQAAQDALKRLESP